MIQVNEHSSSSYGPRTYFNAVNSDVTCAVAIEMHTAGEKLTKKAAGEKYIGFEIGVNLENELDIIDHDLLQFSRELYRFCKKKECKVLNIAGNGIYTWGKYDINQKSLNDLLFRLLEPVVKHSEIHTIISGGQTGTDIAGLNAGVRLGLDVIATLPKGYLQRDRSGIDKVNTKESIIEQIRS
jgi:hypothetical protein